MGLVGRIPPSQYKSLMWVRVLFRNMNTSPETGSFFRWLRTVPASPSNPLRMSVGLQHKKYRRLALNPSMVSKF